MRTICFLTTFAFTFLFNAANATSQTLTEQIINYYNKLNKTEYCQSLIDAYKKDHLKLAKREPPFGNPSDSLCLAGDINYFTNMVNQPDPYFVLNNKNNNKQNQKHTQSPT